MRSLMFTLLLFSFLWNPLLGQKVFQLEKLHTAKTKKFFPGDEITFRLKGGQWYTRVLEDVNYDQNLIVFPDGHASLEDITALKSFKSQKWSRPIATNLNYFAVSWAGFSVISSGVDTDSEQGISFGDNLKDNLSRDITVVGTSILTGFLLKKIFKSRTYRLFNEEKGKKSPRWRLRVLDLTVN